MDVSIISIGNSKGIRLSKMILEKYQIENSVELILEDDCIRIVPKHHPRKNWAEQFSADQENDLLFPETFDDENIEEW